MNIHERLAAAEANLAPTRARVNRSPESLACEHLLAVCRSLASAPAPKAAPLKRVPLGKAAK